MPEKYLVLSIFLFSIGLLGLLLRRNAIVMLMCVELMLNAVNLILVAFSVYYHQSSAQVFVLFIMIVAAAEAAIGLGLCTLIYQQRRSIDVEGLSDLKW